MNQNSRLRILFVAGCWYPDEEHPIHGIFIRRHAETVAREHEVVVLHPTLRTDGPRKPALRWTRHGEVRELHVEIRGVPSAQGSTLRSLLSYFRATRGGLQELSREVAPFDFLHYHVVPSVGVVLATALERHHLPFAVTEHWSGYLPESGVKLGPMRRIYTSMLLRHARFVSTVSHYHASALQTQGFGGLTRVIPNVVDTQLFKATEKRRPGPFRLTLVASLRPEKRVPTIVRCVSALIRQGFELELHIVGDGSERRRAEAEVNPPSLEGSQIFFHGRQQEIEVAERLRDSDALVLFSSFENSPCVIAEAFACGLPVIAPRIGGIPEHVTKDRGILIPPGDEEALSTAIRRLVRHEVSFDAGGIRRYAEQNFSPERVARLFTEAYR